MEQYEFNTHTFVVKIWLEETAEEAGHAVWRGHITHLLSGERRYFEELCDMIVFLIPYLERMEVDTNQGWTRKALARCRALFKSQR